MTRFGVALTLALVGTLGFVGGTTTHRSQEPGTRLVMLEFEISGTQIPSEAIAKLSEWVRITRESGRHQSAKLYMHEWGPSGSLYLVVETDWDGLGSFFSDLEEALPNLMNEPLGFSGHSDNILVEVPVE